MTKKERLKLIKELEQRIGNLRAHVFYGYDLKAQAENVREVKRLAIELYDEILTNEISTP